jgi:thioesterase domain-containing protein
MPYEERMKYFIDKINLKRNDIEKLDKNQIEVILNIFRSNYEAMQNYVPQEYKQEEKVIYYKAAIRDAHNQQNSEHGWQLLLGSQILIKEVSGGHASMLDLPHVEESLVKEILRLQEKDWRVIRT